jgi:hypothetical protein
VAGALAPAAAVDEFIPALSALPHLNPIPTAADAAAAEKVLQEQSLYKPVPGFDQRVGPVEGPMGQPAQEPLLGEAYNWAANEAPYPATFSEPLPNGFIINDVKVNTQDPAIQAFLDSGEEKLRPLLADAQRTGNPEKFLQASMTYVNAQFPVNTGDWKQGGGTLGEHMNEGDGVCRHKAIATKLLMDRLGVPSTLESGNYVFLDKQSGKRQLGPHAWNTVSVDGKPYLFDSSQRKIGDLSNADLANAYKTTYNRSQIIGSVDVNKALKYLPNDYTLVPETGEISTPNGTPVGTMQPGGGAEITFPGSGDPKERTAKIDPESLDVTYGSNGIKLGTVQSDGTIQLDTEFRLALDGNVTANDGAVLGTLDTVGTSQSQSAVVRVRNSSFYYDVGSKKWSKDRVNKSGVTVDAEGNVLAKDGKTVIGTYQPSQGASLASPMAKMNSNELVFDMDTGAVQTADGTAVGTLQDDGTVKFPNGSVLRADGRVFTLDESKPVEIGAYDAAQTAHWKKPLVKLDNGLYLHANDPSSLIATIETGFGIGNMDAAGNVKLPSGEILKPNGRVLSADGSLEVGSFDLANTTTYRKQLVKLDNGTYLHASHYAGIVKTWNGNIELGVMGEDGKILLNGGLAVLSPDAGGAVQDETGKVIGTLDLTKTEETLTNGKTDGRGHPAFKLVGREDVYGLAYDRVKGIDVYTYADNTRYGRLEDGPNGKVLKLPNGTYDALDGQGTILGVDKQKPVAKVQADGTLLAPDGTVIGKKTPEGTIAWDVDGLGKLGAGGGLASMLAGFGLQIAGEFTDNPTLETIMEVVGMLDPIGGSVKAIGAVDAAWDAYHQRQEEARKEYSLALAVAAKYNYDAQAYPYVEADGAYGEDSGKFFDYDPLIRDLMMRYGQSPSAELMRDIQLAMVLRVNEHLPLWPDA